MRQILFKVGSGVVLSLIGIIVGSMEVVAKPWEGKTPAPMSDSQVWGKVFQTESDPDKILAFEKHQSVELMPGVLEGVEKALRVFKGDKGIHNQARLRRLLVATAKHESLGGKLLKQKSGGPAIGAWQIEPETAKDIVKTSGLIGKKAEAIIGKSKEELLELSTEQWEVILKDHNVNAVFATAKYLQGADSKKLLDELKGE